MLLKGDVAIRTPYKRVWDFLMDPSQIGRCAPGVEKLAAHFYDGERGRSERGS